jgi:hypothetical protein
MLTDSPTILSLSAAELADHPILAHIPVWERAQPEFQALVDSIRERGQDYDVLIDSERRVVDGRNRRNACQVLNRPVRCREIDTAEIAEIALSCLVNRRNLTKGALAYLAAPLLKPAVDQARDRRIANLSRSSTESTIEGTPKTAEDLARSLGFGRDLLFYALDLHKKFAGKVELREQFEPKILSGELGLGAALQAIAGKESTEGKKKPIRQVDQLILQGFSDLRNRFGGWNKLGSEKRDKVLAQVCVETAEWPEDVAQAAAAQWKRKGLI